MSYYRKGPFRPGGPGIAFGVPGLTPMVRLLIITNTAIWLLQYVLFVWAGRPVLSPILGVVPYKVVFQGYLWQPLTSMFLHSPQAVFHLIFNMLMLWMFGGELERHWGSRAFLRYYLVCGIGGGVAATLLGIALGGEMARIPTIGASGAIFGLFIAYGMVFAERTILFMLIFPMKARTMAWIMFAVAFFSTWSQQGGGVSHISHLGGAVCGYLYLKRIWRVGEFVREARWRYQRRRFKVMRSDEGDDSDRWVN